ncbi:MAG: hypothetical protein COB08_005530 [Rhodobacteraceae bacterium]|nr:hypothetical protein [Paracoccaceae bacterium]
MSDQKHIPQSLAQKLVFTQTFEDMYNHIEDLNGFIDLLDMVIDDIDMMHKPGKKVRMVHTAIRALKAEAARLEPGIDALFTISKTHSAAVTQKEMAHV